MRDYIIAAVSGIDNGPFDPGVLEEPDLSVKNRLACEWQEAFGTCLSKLAQPASPPRRQDNRSRHRAGSKA